MSPTAEGIEMTGKAVGLEERVRQRYEAAARGREAELCCPVDYDRRYLEVLPAEILERDYGCGDPSRHVQWGDTVLDLGSGAGKICYIAAQVAGPTGRVIGVDFNPEMLDLAERHRVAIGERLGYQNVEFRRGRIQDLALDLGLVERFLAQNPVSTLAGVEAFESFCARIRSEAPLVADESVDLVVSNCVLNLVRPTDKSSLFNEMHRVLRRGGRVAISDIVSDEDVPEDLQCDPDLWTGCISGAFREDRFLEEFERAGFHGIRIAGRGESPWRVVRGIEFRTLTVTASKGKEGPCLERNQAVIYRGPWRKVVDDDGHTLVRGQRTAVCDKTFGILTREPYTSQVIPVPPRIDVSPKAAAPFDCRRTALRHPKETKGEDFDLTQEPPPTVCGPEGGCC